MILDDGVDDSDEEEMEFNEKELSKVLAQKQITHNVVLDLTDNNSASKVKLFLLLNLHNTFCNYFVVSGNYFDSLIEKFNYSLLN